LHIGWVVKVLNIINQRKSFAISESKKHKKALQHKATRLKPHPTAI
jgi:hypothetical protein